MVHLKDRAGILAAAGIKEGRGLFGGRVDGSIAEFARPQLHRIGVVMDDIGGGDFASRDHSQLLVEPQVFQNGQIIGDEVVVGGGQDLDTLSHDGPNPLRDRGLPIGLVGVHMGVERNEARRLDDSSDDQDQLGVLFLKHLDHPVVHRIFGTAGSGRQIGPHGKPDGEPVFARETRIFESFPAPSGLDRVVGFKIGAFGRGYPQEADLARDGIPLAVFEPDHDFAERGALKRERILRVRLDFHQFLDDGGKEVGLQPIDAGRQQKLLIEGFSQDGPKKN